MFKEFFSKKVYFLFIYIQIQDYHHSIQAVYFSLPLLILRCILLETFQNLFFAFNILQACIFMFL
jgi:hypothetical protein